MDHKLESDGVHCPICGKVLVWRKLASFYEEWEPEVGECPNQCTLAADSDEYGGYSPDEMERMRQLADGDV